MLTFRPFQTSSVWKLPDPDTAYLHTGRTRAELIGNIVSYRAQNKLDKIERLDLVLDNYLCSLPENLGKCRQTALQRGFLQYFKGGLTLLSNLWYGEKNMVSQEEADRRSSICKDCPCNVFPDRNMFIKWSDDIALNSIGDRKSAHYNDLGNCEACSCCLRAKVWYRGPFNISKEERAKMQLCNPNCWQLKEK